jgi:hypothetical protein
MEALRRGVETERRGERRKPSRAGGNQRAPKKAGRSKRAGEESQLSCAKGAGQLHRREAKKLSYRADVEKPHHPGMAGFYVGADAFWTEPCGLVAVLTASHTAHALCEPDPPCMGSPLH